MKSIGLSALCCSFVTLAAASAHANTSETSVCVEVDMRRPKSEVRPGSKDPTPNVERDSPANTAANARTQVGAGSNGATEKSIASFEPVAAETPSAPVDQSSAPANAVAVAIPNPEGTTTSADLPADLRVQSGAHLPLGQTPKAYLKRLIEHYVTHERGFVAASDGCTQRIIVELYPLQVGWAAFARYTGNGREERVDQLLPTELSQFAERATTALLHDVTIGDTVDRDNVLWSDSLHSTQRIRGRGHFVLGLGTRLRAGYFDTAITDRANPSYGQVQRSLRVFSPMAVMAGYRGVFDQFGVEALGQFDLGTSQVAAKNNPSGGHVDYAGSLGLVLHVTRYADPRGIASLYYGGGATFELVWFNAIIPSGDRTTDSRSTLMSGGLNADAVIGYEFMRASAVSFFLQGELNVPAYVISSENNAASINTWFPGMKLALGANF
jgi:hypothetical protein